ncbi:MAG: alpha/beta hydrolase [Acidimicrobiales bacterium]
MNKITDDPRIHPRIRRIMGRMPLAPAPTYTDRDELMSIVTKPSSIAKAEAGDAVLDGLDSEDLAPLDGLDISTIEVTSDPDGNTIKILLIRPEGADAVPGVVYLHGGGMMTMSCFLGMYQCWGRLIAHQGVAVAMVDFRNCLRPSSAPEVEPFPAGLNDCVSSVKYLSANAEELGIDPDRLIIAGESGGGNLTLATGMKLLADGDIDLIGGLYALCPYIAGEWPQDRFPSSIENNGIFLDLGGNTGQLAYGIDHFEQQNPLAWPSFATASDVEGLPTTVISVNECDPLRDEGVEFYRMLNEAGVPARCRQVMGTIHASEIFSVSCPEVATETAASIAHLAING